MQEQERRSEHVPRVGELVSFDRNVSFQVVDVLWHLRGEGAVSSVTVTAYERSWHQHIAEIAEAWRKAYQGG